jgi:hypothetical protein
LEKVQLNLEEGESIMKLLTLGIVLAELAIWGGILFQKASVVLD